MWRANEWIYVRCELQVQWAWKVRECDRLRCSAQRRQWGGLSAMMVG